MLVKACTYIRMYVLVCLWGYNVVTHNEFSLGMFGAQIFSENYTDRVRTTTRH